MQVRQKVFVASLCASLGAFAPGVLRAQPPMTVGAEVSLDPAVAAPLESAADAPRVACTATTCLAVWVERDLDASHARAARVRATDGALLDPIPLVLDETDDGHYDVDVATDGSAFLVVWRSYATHEIHGTSVAPSTGALGTSSSRDCCSSSRSRRARDERGPNSRATCRRTRAARA